jgi:hypothetical protein
MADIRYYEPGYIDDDYFDEVISTTGYYIEGYIDDDYIVGGQVKEFNVALEVQVTIIPDAGLIFEAQVDLEAFGSSTLVADALKNHAAVLDAVISMQATVSKIASNTITLDSIINQSLQSDRIRDVDSAQTVSIDIQTAPSVFKDFGALLSSTGGFELLMTVNADVAINVISTLTVAPMSFTGKTYPNRITVPHFFASANTFTNARTTSPSATNIETTFEGTTFAEGSHSLKAQSTHNQGLVLRDGSPSVKYIAEDEEFILEFWMQPTNNWWGDNYLATVGARRPTNSTLADGLSTFSGTISGSLGYNAAWLNNHLIGMTIGTNYNPYGSGFVAFVNAIDNNGSNSQPRTIRLNGPSNNGPTGGWQRLALRRNSSGTIQLIKDTTVLASASYDGRIQIDSSTFDLRGGLYSNLSNGQFTSRILFDNWIFRRGESALTTNVAQPYNQDNVVWHYQFNNDYDETFQALLEGVATLPTTSTMVAVPNATLDGITIHQSSGTLTADANIIQGASADITSTATLNVIPGFVKDANISTDSIASQISVVAKIGDFFVNADVVASLALDISKIAGVTASIQSSYTASIDVHKQTDTQAIPSATTTLSADVSGGFVGGSAQLDVTSTLGILSTVFNNVDANINATATMIANTSVIRSADAQMSSTVALSSTISPIRGFDISTESIATQLVAVAKVGDFLVDTQTVATLAITAQVTSGNAASLDTTTALGINTSNIIRTVDTNMFAVSSLTTVITSGLDAISNQEVITSLDVTPVKIVGATASLASENAFTSIIVATRNNEIELNNVVELSATANSTLSASSTPTAQVTVVATGDKLVNFESLISTSVSITALGQLVHVTEIVYVIPREDRIFTIHNERRTHKITNEIRSYKVGE